MGPQVIKPSVIVRVASREVSQSRVVADRIRTAQGRRQSALENFLGRITCATRSLRCSLLSC